MFRSFASIVLLTAGMAGCESDPVPAEVAAPPRPAATEDPIAEIPLTELYGASPIDNLWSPRYGLEVLDLPAGWNGARFAILSDFQIGLWEENEGVAAAAIAHAVEADPDVILLLGDFLASGSNVSTVERLIAPLRGRTVVAVLGDRDIRSDSLETRLTEVLRAAGVQVLKNTSVTLQRGGDSIVLAGVDPNIAADSFDDQRYILATLGEGARTHILLTHLPALATRAPMARFPITVSGNTFCGEVDVPGTPRIAWLREEAFPGGTIEGRDQLFRVQGSTVLVTCGLGYGFVPLRFGAAPEVPILTLEGVAAPDSVPEAAPAVPDSLIDLFRSDTSVAAPTTSPPDSGSNAQ